jgi:hypothetical protein
VNGFRRVRLIKGRVFEAIGSARQGQNPRGRSTPGPAASPPRAGGAGQAFTSWKTSSVSELRAKCLGELSWTRGYLPQASRERLLTTVVNRFPNGMAPALRERLARDLEHYPFWDCLATWLRSDSVVGLVGAWPELVPALAEFLSSEPVALCRSPYGNGEPSQRASDDVPGSVASHPAARRPQPQPRSAAR